LHIKNYVTYHTNVRKVAKKCHRLNELLIKSPAVKLFWKFSIKLKVHWFISSLIVGRFICNNSIKTIDNCPNPYLIFILHWQEVQLLLFNKILGIHQILYFCCFSRKGFKISSISNNCGSVHLTTTVKAA